MSADTTRRPAVRLRPKRGLNAAAIRWREFREFVVKAVLFCAASSSVLITAAIVWVLIHESAGFFRSQQNARQQIELSGVTGGSFTLSFQEGETPEIPYNASAAAVQSALESVEKLAGSVAVTGDAGGPWTIEFKQSLGGREVTQLTANGKALASSESRPISVETVVEGQKAVTIWEFLTSTEWAPLFHPPKHGILPLFSATLVTTVIALAVALPLGLTISIYLSEFAPHQLREFIKPSLELLSAVPTVVYGYFALQFVTPYLLKPLISDLPSSNMLSAGLVMGVMIIPYVSSLSEDAMRSVPMLLREGAYALGGNKITTAFRVVIPSAFSGIAAAFILAISRAIGETMIVAVAAGMQPKLTFDPRQQAQTITSFIAATCQGEAEYGTVAYQSIFAAGLALFVVTLAFNLLGFYLKRRFHQAY